MAILLQSQRHLVGAIRRKQPLPWECQFSYLTDRHSAGSSRWAQDGVRRQPAIKRHRGGEKSPGANVG
mgnify:FL=1